MGFWNRNTGILRFGAFPNHRKRRIRQKNALGKSHVRFICKPYILIILEPVLQFGPEGIKEHYGLYCTLHTFWVLQNGVVSIVCYVSQSRQTLSTFTIRRISPKKDPRSTINYRFYIVGRLDIPQSVFCRCFLCVTFFLHF